MIWVTWRQHRAQLLAGGAFVSVALLFLGVTGPGIWSTFHSSGLAGCLAARPSVCSGLANAFDQRYTGFQFLVPLFLILPVLIGVFWGAPLVAREMEQGTYRLAWTQGVTRTRWLGAKLATLAAVTVVGIAAFTLVLAWWSRPLAAAGDNRLNPGIFDLRGVVPVAYALFALVLGIAVGTIIRRTLPAMAATVAAYVGARVAVLVWLRPHYAAAKTVAYSVLKGGPPMGRSDWVLSTTTLDRAGHFMGSGSTLDFNLLQARCPGLIPAPGRLPGNAALQQCVHKVGLHVQAVYQPGSRFALFQGIEAVIFTALAACLVGLTIWAVRRRLT